MHNVGAIDRYRISSMILMNEFSGATFPAPSIDRPGRVAMKPLTSFPEISLIKNPMMFAIVSSTRPLILPS